MATRKTSRKRTTGSIFGGTTSRKRSTSRKRKSTDTVASVLTPTVSALLWMRKVRLTIARRRNEVVKVRDEIDKVHKDTERRKAQRTGQKVATRASKPKTGRVQQPAAKAQRRAATAQRRAGGAASGRGVVIDQAGRPVKGRATAPKPAPGGPQGRKCGARNSTNGRQCRHDITTETETCQAGHTPQDRGAGPAGTKPQPTAPRPVPTSPRPMPGRGSEVEPRYAAARSNGHPAPAGDERMIGED
jgi:hypothetical protein